MKDSLPSVFLSAAVVRRKVAVPATSIRRELLMSPEEKSFVSTAEPDSE